MQQTVGAVGMDRRTGRPIYGWDHVLQSIEDILTTRLMQRVMRREYGSLLPRLIDAPMNDRVVLAFYAAAAEALRRWEPRFRLRRCSITRAGSDGGITLELSGVYYPRGHLGDYSVMETRDGALHLLGGAA